MWRHYVYIHKRKSDGVVFYVGKGSMRPTDKRQTYKRAKSSSLRSLWWQRVAEKHGFEAEIIADCRTDGAAQNLEKALIKKYGRLQLGLGTLVNMTDGGDGHSGVLTSDDLRRKRSENAKKPRGNYPQNRCDNISIGKKGKPIKCSGNRTNAKHCRRVIDITSGHIYPSITIAAKELGVSLTHLGDVLHGRRGYKPHKTLRFV